MADLKCVPKTLRLGYRNLGLDLRLGPKDLRLDLRFEPSDLGLDSDSTQVTSVQHS